MIFRANYLKNEPRAAAELELEAILLKHIHNLVAPQQTRVEKDTPGSVLEVESETVAPLAPRTDQIQKALAKASYQRLQQAYAAILLEELQPRKKEYLPCSRIAFG